MIGVGEDFANRFPSLFVGSIPDGIVFGLDREDAALADGDVLHQLHGEVGFDTFA